MGNKERQKGAVTQLLRAVDVARILSLTRQHVYALAASGELPSIKLRGAVRFDKGDVEEYIRQHRRKKPADGNAA